MTASVFLAPMPASPKGKRPTRTPSLPTLDDFERYLVTSAAVVAPADVAALVVRGRELLVRLAGDRPAQPQLARRARIALHLLTDHVRSACPQIPYQTISVLAAALLYYLEPLDVIPDFIPRAGTADDNLVLDIAWRLAAPGVQRYVDWKGLPQLDLEVELASTRMPQSVAGAGQAKQAAAQRGATQKPTARPGSTRRR